MTRQRRCAIIGAGASGITSTRWALAYGVEPVVFEKASYVGGLWRYNPNEKENAGVIRATTTNTSKEMIAFSDFPPPDNAPMFLPHNEMLKYLHAYAEHHEVLDHVRFRHTVLSVERADDYEETGRWTVRYRNDAIGDREITETFDAVLMCQGNQLPLRTGIDRPNSAEFQGRILHACEVKSFEEFAGTTTIVVGFRPSATDIAVEVSSVADKVYMSTRSGGYAMTRVSAGAGQPLCSALYSRFFRMLPEWVRDLNLKRNFLIGVDHEKFGLARASDPVKQKGITVSDDLAGRIAAGTVVIRPDIAEYTKTGVKWTDGTTVDHVDNVIFCTGYRPDNTLVEGGRLLASETEKGRGFLYMDIFPPQLADHNTLGLINPLYVFGPLMPTFELMARCFFEQLVGVSRLPAKDEMSRLVEAEREAAYAKARRSGTSLRIQLIRDMIPFWDAMADLIGCRPSIWRILLSGDWRLATALLFGMNVPYAYRLHGPHAWEGAREALLDVPRRMDNPTARDDEPSALPLVKKLSIEVDRTFSSAAAA